MGKIIRNGINYGGTYDSATSVNYDNSNSGLPARTVQEGIDVLNNRIESVDDNTTNIINSLSGRITTVNQNLETITDQEINITSDNKVQSYEGYLALKAGVMYANLILNSSFKPNSKVLNMNLFRFKTAKHPNVNTYIPAIVRDANNNCYNCVILVAPYGTSSTNARVILVSVEESAVNVALTQIFFSGSWLPYRA